jgi:hypothetical protein
LFGFFGLQWDDQPGNEKDVEDVPSLFFCRSELSVEREHTWVARLTDTFNSVL